MSLLLHGTTRKRAVRIEQFGPDPDFVEPGGRERADGFSTYFAAGPFLFGAPEEYARQKAAAFPMEGGAVILEVDVPEAIINLAVNEYFPRSQGLVQFDRGAGLEELREAWPALQKVIKPVQTP